MLKLTPSSLGDIYWRQVRDDCLHLRTQFTDTLVPLIGERLSSNQFTRKGVGTIEFGDALSLFLLSYRHSPKYIAEIGTYLGNSSAAIAHGASINSKKLIFSTCDRRPCNPSPLEGLNGKELINVDVINGSSTEMFAKLVQSKTCLDMLFIDGSLLDEDMPLLTKVLNKNTLIAIDDCVNDEKGHMNLRMLKRAGIVKPPIALDPLPLETTDLFGLAGLHDTHIYIEPFSKGFFRTWGIESGSKVGFLMPRNNIIFSNQ